MTDITGPVSGWLALDKPAGMTSTAALARLKRLLKIRKAGHAGTLDPFASGALPVAFGEATKTVPYVMEGCKVYRFTVVWGEARDTDDITGQTVDESARRPEREEIGAVLDSFQGDILQRPPQYSAVHVGGKRAYRRARSGERFNLQARPVRVDSLRLLKTGDGEAAEVDENAVAATSIEAREGVGQYAWNGAKAELDARHQEGGHDMNESNGRGDSGKSSSGDGASRSGLSQYATVDSAPWNRQGAMLGLRRESADDRTGGKHDGAPSALVSKAADGQAAVSETQAAKETLCSSGDDSTREPSTDRGRSSALDLATAVAVDARGATWDSGEGKVSPDSGISSQTLGSADGGDSKRFRDSDCSCGTGWARFEMVCGKGVYVRSVARDLGEALGCLGYVSALRRLASGPFTAQTPLDMVERMGYIEERRALLLPVSAGLDGIPALEVTRKEAQRLRQGMAIGTPHTGAPQGAVVWASLGGEAVAICSAGDGMLRPTRVLHPS